jgi:hypothetical protein
MKARIFISQRSREVAARTVVAATVVEPDVETALVPVIAEPNHSQAASPLRHVQTSAQGRG